MVQIQLTIAQGGATTIHVACLLYDLWEDYTYYRQEAESIDREKEPLRYKRLVRAAVHSYFGYFEGVLNSWIAQIDPTLDLEETSFAKKLGVIRQHVANKTRVPFLNIERARNIRNTIVHLKPTDKDVYIMETLLEGRFFRDADDFTNWLNLASHALKIERHPNVNKILEHVKSGIAR